ncbi:MAG: hypothetical protein H7317_14405, partial [Pseudorhodobacter sp.]|nr:hypothetical protein [Pseudorhodobacter sp.]
MGQVERAKAGSGRVLNRRAGKIRALHWEKDMKRRAFLLSTGGVAAGMVLLPQFAMADAGRIDWYTSSDQNIMDFWTNIVQPKFEAANPGITLNLVDAGDNAGNLAIPDRALAALASKTDPQSDFFENFDPRLPKGGIEAGLYVNIK